jgi:copper chaperone
VDAGHGGWGSIAGSCYLLDNKDRKRSHKKMKSTLNVKGMHCGSCEMLIKETLEEEKGIKKAEPSQANSLVIVDYDEKLIGLSKIKQAIKELGYEVQ